MRFVGERRGRVWRWSSIPSSSASVIMGTGTSSPASSSSSSSTSFASVHRGAGIAGLELVISSLFGELEVEEMAGGGESAIRKIRERGEGTAGAYGFFFNRACAAEREVGVEGALKMTGREAVVLLMGDSSSLPGVALKAATADAEVFLSGDRFSALRDCAAWADCASIWSNGLVEADAGNVVLGG